MKSRTIKSKLYVVTTVITMLLFSAVLTNWLGGIMRSSNQKYHRIIEMENEYFDLILDEMPSLLNPSKYEDRPTNRP